MKTVKIMSTFELLKRFPNNEVAIKYLEDLQWSNGVFCIRCKERKRICKRKRDTYNNSTQDNLNDLFDFYIDIQ